MIVNDVPLMLPSCQCQTIVIVPILAANLSGATLSLMMLTTAVIYRVTYRFRPSRYSTSISNLSKARARDQHDR
jgi:hypothetical protein